MFLPAGQHSIVALDGGLRAEWVANILPASIPKINKQLEELKNKGMRPFISLDYDNDAVAFYVNSFVWKNGGSFCENDGIYCVCDQVCSDEDLKLKSVFPTFFIDRSQGEMRFVFNCEGSSKIGYLVNYQDSMFWRGRQTFRVS